MGAPLPSWCTKSNIAYGYHFLFLATLPRNAQAISLVKNLVISLANLVSETCFFLMIVPGFQCSFLFSSTSWTSKRLSGWTVNVLSVPKGHTPDVPDSLLAIVSSYGCHCPSNCFALLKISNVVSFLVRLSLDHQSTKRLIIHYKSLSLLMLVPN